MPRTDPSYITCVDRGRSGEKSRLACRDDLKEWSGGKVRGHVVPVINSPLVLPNFLHPVLRSLRYGYVLVTYGGAYVRNARNIGGDMLARSEAVLYWLGSGVAVAFIGLVVIEPERVERTMMGVLTRIVSAFVAVLSGS